MSFGVKTKLNANALYIVVSVAIISALIISGLLMTAGLYADANNSLEVRNKLTLNCNSALQLCLASKELSESQQIDLFNEQSDSVLIARSAFGILNYATVTAFQQSDSVRKIHLLGSKSTQIKKTAIYLCNANQSLGVCGKTKLNGNVFVPEKGIERVYIEGQNFIGSRLFSGNKKVSATDLPAIHPTLLKNIENIQAKTSTTAFPAEKDSIKSQGITQHYFSDGVIILTQNISGNIIIESGKKIIVSASAKIENAILKAPAIDIEQNFKGRLQCYARDSIRTGNNCKFLAPSFLEISTSPKRGFSPKIILGEANYLAGNIVLLQDQFSLKNNGIVTINKNTTVNGTIYSQGYTQLKECTIEGSVYSRKMYLKTFSSVYENTLLNVSIDPDLRDTNRLDLGIQKSERGWILLK